MDNIANMLEEKLKLRQSNAPKVQLKMHQREQRKWCKFCRIVDGDKNEQVMAKNDKCVVFSDIRPASEHHLLVIPKVHIDSILSLTTKSHELLTSMEQLGIATLADRIEGEIDENELLFGFHRPPHNSVFHLHLHVVYPKRAMSARQLKRICNGGWTTISTVRSNL